MAPGQLKVNIFGSEYSLVADGSEEYLKEVAKYVDKKMRNIDKNQSFKASTKLAILAALNIADELFQERANKEKIIKRLNNKTEKMNNSLTEVLED
jgi:cell division protein ZapA